MSYIAKVIVLVLTLNTLADAEELILSGVYVVPTSEKNLTQAAQFKVTNYKIIEPNSADPVIQFTLPIELTGVVNTLEFHRAQIIDPVEKTALYISSSGSALCYGPWVSLKCFFKFKDLQIEEVKVKQVLSDLFKGQQFSQKLILAQAFMGEPVGILQIAKKPIRP